LSELNNLDLAHKAMIDAPDNEVARLAYYHCLADCELYVLLATEPVDGDMVPAIFSLETGTFVLVFDREERLADFAAGPVPYAVLPGRVIAGQLSGQSLGIGVNLGGSEGAFVMPQWPVERRRWLILRRNCRRWPGRLRKNCRDWARWRHLPISWGQDLQMARQGMCWRLRWPIRPPAQHLQKRQAKRSSFQGMILRGSRSCFWTAPR
jgi:hypothetical protein